MGTIPVANPSPPRRLGVPHRGLRVLVLLFAGLMLIVVGIAFAWPTGSKVDQATWVNAGSVSDFSVNEPVRFYEQRFWLVRLETGEFVALLTKSPYRGCTIPWRPDFEFMGKKGWFRDPCHNDTFAIDGTHVIGPAPRGMDRLPVRVDDGVVRVDVKSTIPGEGASPP